MQTVEYITVTYKSVPQTESSSIKYLSLEDSKPHRSQEDLKIKMLKIY